MGKSVCGTCMLPIDEYGCGCETADLEAETDALRAEVERLRKWADLGAWVMASWPDIADIDGFMLHDMAVKSGVLVEVPGGYDPERDIDSLGVAPERGDPWFEIIASPSALAPAGDA